MATTGAPAPDSNDRILDAVFVRLTGAAFLYFMGMGATFPVLPRFVSDGLGRGDAAVGVALGAMAVGAILARPAIGAVGDRSGRRVLLVSGGLLSAAAMVAHIAVDGLALLLPLRVVFGVGQGALIVGATTMAVDRVSESRSGEATSYVFVALHLGNALGALVGEELQQSQGFDAAWLMCAVVMTASALLASTLPPARPDVASTGPVGMLHPTAVGPGIVLGIGTLGFIGFNAFVPLFADELGIEDAAPFFLATSVTIVVVRSLGARLPDRLGPRTGASVALVILSSGLFVTGLADSFAWLLVGSIVLASGNAILLPSLVPAAVRGVPATERSRALGTYTLFLEFSAALGGVVFGGIASVSSYGTAFVVVAGFSLTALVVSRLVLPTPSPHPR